MSGCEGDAEFVRQLREDIREFGSFTWAGCADGDDPREAFYVAMTRGRHANNCYVATDELMDDTAHLGHDDTSAVAVLTRILKTSGAEPAAHQAKQEEEGRWLGTAQLLTECQQLIREARRDWEAQPQEVRREWLRAQTTGRPTPRRTIAGLIQEPTFPIAPEIRHALNERRKAIEDRITMLATQALRDQPAWVQDLGPRPTETQARARWDTALRTVLIYRDAYGIPSDQILGGVPAAVDQRQRRAASRTQVRLACEQPQPDLISERGPSVAQRRPIMIL
jgi:hypothetical protein